MKKEIMFCLVFAVLTVFCARASDGAEGTIEEMLIRGDGSKGPSYWFRMEKIAHLRGQMSKLLQVPINWDEKRLSAGDRKAVDKMIEASRYIDRIFMRQVYSRNEALEESLKASSDPLDALCLRYFWINMGPFDRLDSFRAFIGEESHPPGGNFYPADMTSGEFEEWLKSHPQDREAFIDNFTVIRRKEGGLTAVPYSVEYRDLLEPAARCLTEAAAHVRNESLKNYLLQRARAFRTNDYYPSDCAWMDIKGSPVELVIGPYEVYEDSLFNYKAAFESFVVLNLPEEAEKFACYTEYLKEMEAHLPIADTYKDLERDFSSPIRIVQEIFAAGDGRAGIHTSAFALPNDERVRKERGCKKMMLKNIMEAKFNGSTYPVACAVIAPDQLCHVTFDAYFRDTLFHELSHGLGPKIVKSRDGSFCDVRTMLKDNYSSIEECKADTLSVYNQLYLMEKSVIPARDIRKLALSYLAGIFRSVRFGIEEAHGRGSLIQFNWMMEKGAFTFDPGKGRYGVEWKHFAAANASLAREVLEIQAAGDYQRSRAFLAHYGKCPAGLALSLSRLREVPVDIEPLYDCRSRR